MAVVRMDCCLNQILHWLCSWNSRVSLCVPDISDKTSRSVLRLWLLLLSLATRISGSHQASGGSLADVSQVGFKGALLALGETEIKENLHRRREPLFIQRWLCPCPPVLPTCSCFLLTRTGNSPVGVQPDSGEMIAAACLSFSLVTWWLASSHQSS